MRQPDERLRGERTNSNTVLVHVARAPFPYKTKQGDFIVDELCHCGCLRSHHADRGEFIFGYAAAMQDAAPCLRITTDEQGRQAFGDSFYMSKEPISVLEFQQTTFKKDNDTMKIISVKYERVSNLGGYETERVQAEATVDDGENAVTVAANLKAWVNEQLGIVDLSADQIKSMERTLARAKQRSGR